MTIGKAYGFFDCKYSKKDIERELPTIRNLTKTPSELELSLIEGTENLRGDSDLTSIARDAKESGIKYVFDATHDGATNEETADKLATILNQAYQSPLFEKGEKFHGAVVYEDKGKYVFRD
jgi:hypothetical protein